MILASEADGRCEEALRLARAPANRAMQDLLVGTGWHRYALEVLHGTVPACAYVRLACARYVRDVFGMPGNGYRFYPKPVYEVLDYCRQLRHFKGRLKKQSFEPEPWQEFIVANVYGFYLVDEDEDLVRRFTEAWLEVTKKSGKSFLAAALGLHAMEADEDAEVYSAATSMDQARLIFGAATRLVAGNERLASKIRVAATQMIDTHSESVFKPLAKTEANAEGKNTSMMLLDEVHMHPDRMIYDSLKTGMAERLQPLTIMTTTAGQSTQCFGWERHKQAAAMLRGTAPSERLFAYMSGVDLGDEDHWMEPRVWRKANPNMGVSVKRGFLKTQAQGALDDATARAAFKQKNLNIWTGAGKAWLDLAKWDACAGEAPYPTLEDFRGEPCYMGVDLAATTDLTALSVLVDRDPLVYLFLYFFVPELTIPQRVKEDKVPYDVWRDQELLIATPGAVTDYSYVEDKIKEVDSIVPVEELRYDPYNATDLMGRLSRDGVKCVQHRQGVLSMNEPTKEFHRWVIGNMLRHGDHPVLRWCAGNVVVSPGRNDTYSPDKDKSVERIDGITAAIIGTAGVIAARAEGYSPYATEEVSV